MAMKRKIRDLWVRALIGGNFTQGKQALRDSHNNCCCLGVLCELVDPKGWHLDSPHRWYYSHHNSTTWPNKSLCREVGLSKKFAQKLAEMNDEGKSFVEIAQYILTYL